MMEDFKNEEMEAGVKEENETISTENLGTTPSDGESVSANPPKRKMEKKTKIIISAAIAAIVILALIVIVSVFRSNARAQYAENLELCATTMLRGAAKSEDACNLIKSVWFNSIYKESDEETNAYTIKASYYSPGQTYYSDYAFHDDFNTALSQLFASSDFLSSIKEIESNRDVVEMQLKRLVNPPDDLEDCYETLEELSDVYFDFVKLASSPSGSLQTYNDNFSEYDNKLVSLYDKVMRQIPGK